LNGVRRYFIYMIYGGRLTRRGPPPAGYIFLHICRNIKALPERDRMDQE
jgi:hypothetical protein